MLEVDILVGETDVQEFHIRRPAVPRGAMRPFPAGMVLAQRHAASVQRLGIRLDKALRQRGCATGGFGGAGGGVPWSPAAPRCAVLKLQSTLKPGVPLSRSATTNCRFEG